MSPNCVLIHTALFQLKLLQTAELRKIFNKVDRDRK